MLTPSLLPQLHLRPLREIHARRPQHLNHRSRHNHHHHLHRANTTKDKPTIAHTSDGNQATKLPVMHRTTIQTHFTIARRGAGAGLASKKLASATASNGAEKPLSAGRGSSCCRRSQPAGSTTGLVPGDHLANPVSAANRQSKPETAHARISCHTQPLSSSRACARPTIQRYTSSAVLECCA